MSKTPIATRDLPLDEAQHLAALMLRVHDDFRRRHALPPLPTVWTLLDDMKALRSRASLADPGILESRALGGALTIVRRMFWTVLKPLWFRQSEVNRDLIFALEALAREREQIRHAHFVLAERIAELEAELARSRE